MKRLLGLLLCLLPLPAPAQIPPVGSITVGTTSVTNGTNGDCLTISNGKLGQTSSCGAASGLTVGTSSITGGGSGNVLVSTSNVLQIIGYGSASSASTIIQRDANSNAFANNFASRGVSAAGAGTTTALTAADARFQTITGTLGQTFKLPDATTLTNGARFFFNNNGSAGTLTVQNAGAGAVTTVAVGGFINVNLLDNSTTNGTWDNHAELPANASWSTSGINVSGNFVVSTNSTTALTLDTSQNATFAKNVAITGASLTSGSIASVTGTWNSGGVTFPGAILLNMTDTASAAASLLMDLQVGSASKFSVSKAGNVTLAGGSAMSVGTGGLTVGARAGMGLNTAGDLSSVSGGRIGFTGSTTDPSAAMATWWTAGTAGTFVPNGTGNTGSIQTVGGTVNYLGSGGGAADVITLTPTVAVTAYATGACYTYKSTAANATTTPTMNISSLGAKTIVKRAATALAAGDITNGGLEQICYDGTNMQLINPVVN